MQTTYRFVRLLEVNGFVIVHVKVLPIDIERLAGSIDGGGFTNLTYAASYRGNLSAGRNCEGYANHKNPLCHLMRRLLQHMQYH